MSLGGLKSTGNRGNRGSAENVAFQVKAYHFEGKTPSDKDYIEAYLLHSVGDLEAKMDAEGNPLTVVKIRYNAPNDKNGKRPSILEFSRGRGNAKAVEVGGLGIISSAYVDGRTGDLVGNWLERYYPKIDGELHFPLPNVVSSVRPEKPAEGEKRAFQGRYIMSPDHAELFSGVAEFQSKAAAVIDSLAQLPGASGIVVRIVDKNALLNGGEAPTASVEFFEGWDGEAKARKGGEATVAAWLADERNAGWVEAIKGQSPDYIYEIIPQMRIPTGPMSLPSAKLADSNAEPTDQWKWRNDDSERFRFRFDGRTEAGYARSHVHVFRMANDTDQWLSGGTHQAEAFPVILHQSEVISKNLPDNVKEKILANAQARKDAARNNNKPADKPAEEDAPAPAGRSM